MMKILVLSRGVVGRDMASPGIRAYHMARVLAEQLPEARVTLSVPNEPDIPSPHPRLRIVRSGSLPTTFLQMLGHDIIISRNFPPHVVPLFLHKLLAVDFFTTFFVEWMELSKRIPNLHQRQRWMSSNRHYLDYQFTLADFVICSNERQRDLWVGTLSALNLVTPQVYDRDSTLRRLIDVVPYGVQPGRPQHIRQVLKGVVPGIRETDKVLIWNGLLVEWFDAETVIRAMAEVSRVRNDIKLFFLGTEHPERVTGIEEPPVRQAIDLSKQLGVYERSVFFNVGWVPYHDIGNFLSEADIGICAGFDNLEARYSYRTRFVDLFWAELPIICTHGDVLADLVRERSLGIVVPACDVQATASSIFRLVDDQAFYEQCRENLRAIKPQLSWEITMEPLIRFCRAGESFAVAKHSRFLPILSRSARYLLSRFSFPYRGNPFELDAAGRPVSLPAKIAPYLRSRLRRITGRTLNGKAGSHMD